LNFEYRIKAFCQDGDNCKKVEAVARRVDGNLSLDYCLHIFNEYK
jgi:hypothetical protein